MIFLNGEFIDQVDAKISTLDRGFLFGDSIYEVIPVYNQKIFQLEKHLSRLNNSLNAVKITNPYTKDKYIKIFTKLIRQAQVINQVIYLQISRGVGKNRSHQYENLIPTVYIRIDKLNIRSKDELKQGFKAIIQSDIRWHNCDIKSNSLLANILYANTAKENNVEEVILEREGVITEGASSNIFILKDKVISTPKLSNHILPGVTRNMVIKSCQMADISVFEVDISKDELLNANTVWISSSTREIMPIIKIDQQKFNSDHKIWQQVYENFQILKNN